MLSKLKQKLLDFWTFGRILLIGVLLVPIIVLVLTIQVLNDNYKLQLQVDSANLDNQIMELENQNLRLEQMYYQTDEYQELSARSLLGKSLPGEHVVILPRVEHATDETTDGKAVVTKSNFDQWLDFLMGPNN